MEIPPEKIRTYRFLEQTVHFCEWCNKWSTRTLALVILTYILLSIIAIFIELLLRNIYFAAALLTGAMVLLCQLFKTWLDMKIALFQTSADRLLLLYVDYEEQKVKIDSRTSIT